MNVLLAKKMKADWEKFQRIAADELASIYDGLPELLGQEAKRIPVIFERVPSRDLLADGIEPDTLGIFTGAEYVAGENELLPAQIILFLENIWEFSGRDEEVYRAEIQTTYLHELGHFLGLDEDALKQRGLE